jgi:hypothetical protein
MLRHRKETRMLDFVVPQAARLDAARDGMVRFTRSLREIESSGLEAYKTGGHQASTSTAPPPGKDVISCVVDYCEPDVWPGMPQQLGHFCLLWMPTKPRGRAEVTWEEARGLYRSLGKDGMFVLLDYLRFLYSIRLFNTQSRTLMGFDNPWMPAGLRSPEHNYGHDLSHLFSS